MGRRRDPRGLGRFERDDRTIIIRIEFLLLLCVDVQYMAID